MQGGDNVRALENGEHYYSIRQGSLGYAIRGKSPIIAQNGSIIGVVSVGYLLENVSNWLLLYSSPVFFALLLVLLFSSLGAWFFTKHIKKQMYGMEPEEIALSLRIQKSVLTAVYEGVVAVDNKGRLLAANKRALSILGIAHQPSYLVGRMVNEFMTPACFFMGANQHDGSNNMNASLDMKDELIACNGET